MGSEQYHREHIELAAEQVMVTRQEIVAFLSQELAQRESELYRTVLQFFEQCDIEQFEARSLNIYTVMDDPAFTTVTKGMTKQEKADVQSTLSDVLERALAWKTVQQTEGFSLFVEGPITREFAKQEKGRAKTIVDIKDYALGYLHDLLRKNTQ